MKSPYPIEPPANQPALEETFAAAEGVVESFEDTKKQRKANRLMELRGLAQGRPELFKAVIEVAINKLKTVDLGNDPELDFILDDNGAIQKPYKRLLREFCPAKRSLVPPGTPLSLSRSRAKAKIDNLVSANTQRARFIANANEFLTRIEQKKEGPSVDF